MRLLMRFALPRRNAGGFDSLPPHNFKDDELPIKPLQNGKAFGRPGEDRGGQPVPKHTEEKPTYSVAVARSGDQGDDGSRSVGLVAPSRMIDSPDDSDAPDNRKHTGDCRLCGAANVQLLDGHIIPKWAYRRARGAALPGLAPDPILIKGGIALQTSSQITEYLMCRTCEQRLGRDEDYVKRLAYQDDGRLGVMGLVDPATVVRPRGNPIGTYVRAFPIQHLDCLAAARFAASVFWRAHVAKRARIDSLFLWNPQAEALRLFVLGEKPLPERLCLTMWAIAEGEELDTVHSRTLATPSTAKKGTDSQHQFIVAGLMFTLTTGARSPSSLCLACSPTPHLLIQDWQHIGFLRNLTHAAVSAEPKGRGAKAARLASVPDSRGRK